MWYTTAAFCRKTGNRSIREGTAKDSAIRRRPARDSLGHTSRLDRTRTGAAFSFVAGSRSYKRKKDTDNGNEAKA